MIRNDIDDTASALLEAAHRLLTDDGLEAMTVRRIAHEAGMSTMILYSRFGGKAGVLDELYLDGHRRLLAALRAARQTGDIEADLASLARTYRQFALDNRTHYRLMFGPRSAEFPRPDSLSVARVGLGLVASRIEQARQRGRIAPFEPPPALQVATAYWATCHGLVSFELDWRDAVEGPDGDLEPWRTIFEHGIRAVTMGLAREAVPVAG